jgi:ABC-type nitrate/sulfonate/bicarbonate transport system substrate-binding protein
MELKIALDWTPNPIHSGIFLARAKGWYRELGIDLKLIGVEADQYQKSTLDKLLSGEAELAIVPSEMLLQANKEGAQLIALASLLQGSASCLATTSNIQPGQNVRYGALQLPFENAVLKQVWKGDVSVVIPPRLDLYKQLFDGHVDLVWLYKPIEGVEAELNGISLKYYSLEEASVPYGHSPILVTKKKILDENPRELSRLLEVSARGYSYTAFNNQEAVEILFALNVPGMRDRILLKEQLSALTPFFLNENEQWGVMEEDRWRQYYLWLNKTIGFKLTENELSESFTNEILKQPVIKA